MLAENNFIFCRNICDLVTALILFLKYKINKSYSTKIFYLITSLAVQ